MIARQPEQPRAGGELQLPAGPLRSHRSVVPTIPRFYACGTVVLITQWFLPAVVPEAGLLVETAGGAVEEGGRGLLAAGVLRVGLHHATARLRDQVQGSAECAAATPLRRCFLSTKKHVIR